MSWSHTDGLLQRWGGQKTGLGRRRGDLQLAHLLFCSVSRAFPGSSCWNRKLDQTLGRRKFAWENLCDPQGMVAGPRRELELKLEGLDLEEWTQW